MSLLVHPKLADVEGDAHVKWSELLVVFLWSVYYRFWSGFLSFNLMSAFSVDLVILRRTLSCDFINGIFRR